MERTGAIQVVPLLCRLIATLAVLIRPAVLAQTSPATSGHDEAFYISFQVPDYHDTYPQSINRSFSVAGYCAQATSHYHGFVRGSEGRINLIDPPGSTFTIARGINAAGAIVGYFQSLTFSSTVSCDHPKEFLPPLTIWETR